MLLFLSQGLYGDFVIVSFSRLGACHSPRLFCFKALCPSAIRYLSLYWFVQVWRTKWNGRGRILRYENGLSFQGKEAKVRQKGRSQVRTPKCLFVKGWLVLPSYIGGKCQKNYKTHNLFKYLS